jgi:hypothetical protein
VRAEVRVLSPKQFNLATAPVNYTSPDGYEFRMEVKRDPAGCAEVITYTGDSINWLFPDQPPDEAAN